MNTKIKQAFTLIELLVVIAIIGILSGLIVVSMGGMTQKATIAKAQVFSNSLRNSLMLNIIGEWKFDELASPVINNSSIKDSWGTSNCTLSTGADPAADKMSTDCISGKCLAFDGTDDYANCGTGINSVIETNFTFSAWVRPKTYDIERFFISKGGQKPALDYYQSRFAWTVNGGTSYLFSTTYPSQDIWYFVNGVYDGTTSKIYVNGVLENSAAVAFVSDSNPLYIGWYYAGTGHYMKGSIDDVRIYNTIIPISQIKNQYYSGLNNLLINGNINKEEYLIRINQAIAEK